MNQSQNYRKELLVGQLAMILEALEGYIREGNYFSDWASKEQFYARTASVYKISLEVAEGGFFSQFSVAIQAFLNKERVFFPAPIDKNLHKEIQKKFYKWIDNSGITAKGCPEKLKHYLIKERHSISEIRSYQQKIKQAIQAKVKGESTTTNGGEFSWSTKIAIGVGIIGIVFGAIVVIYQVIKNKKVKK